MNALPLAPFLAALASDGIRLTLRDYERVHLALHSAGDWTLPRLHDVLLALLAKDQAQQEILTRRFNEFFQLPPKSERQLSAVELDRVIAELNSLSSAPPSSPKTKPSRFDRPREPVPEPSSRKPTPVWWIVAAAIFVIIAAVVWRMLPQDAPAPSPNLHLNTPEAHFGNILVGSVGRAEAPITNRGTAPLVIDSLALAGTQAGLFKTIRDYSGVVIAPDSSMQIALVCSARVQGDFTDTLQIFSNKTDSPHRVTLRATGFILQDTLQVTRAPSERKRLYTNVPYVKSITYSPLKKIDDWKWSALIAMLMLVITVIYAVYLWRSRKIPEDKPPVWDESKPRHFSMAAIGGKSGPRLDDATLDQLADAMGYFKTEQPGKMLDVPASITATGRNGGMPTLAFHQRKQMRALLILEDAFAEALAWNSIGAELAEGMRRRGVPVVHGKFHGSPEQFKTPDGMQHRLEDLEDERRGYLLLLFTDGKSLSRFDKLTASRVGELLSSRRAFALERLGRWPMIAWMDLREPRLWETTANLPTRYGIPLYPATSKGLLQAVRHFLTERGLQQDFSQSSEQAADLPAQFEVNPQVYVEQWLGEALPWAQDCAMMVQPMSLGLADALRRRFHSHVQPEFIDRLLTLPGTTHSAAGIRFSAEVLKVLRRRFLVRRDEHEQEEVLVFLLAKIKEAKPAEAGSPSYLAWEAVQERVRLEQKPDDDLQRLGELAQTPLAASVRASLENFGFVEEQDKIPLRVKPRNKNALQRLARITKELGIKKLDTFSIGSGPVTVLILLGVFVYYSTFWSVIQYLDATFRKTAEARQRLEVVLVLDFTRSMALWRENNVSGIELITQNVMQLIDSLGPANRIAILEFHDRNETHSVISDFTSNKFALRQALDRFLQSMIEYGSSGCWDALYAGVRLFPEPPQTAYEKVALLISDGYDTASEHRPEEIITLALKRNVSIHAIGIGALAEHAKFENLASATGGEYFSAADFAAFARQWTLATRNLREQVDGVLGDLQTEARLEALDGGVWRDLGKGNLIAMPRSLRLAGFKHRLILYGNGHRTIKEFETFSDSLVKISIARDDLDVPCHEEYPAIGLTVENCPDNNTQLVSQKTWKETLGDQAPADRLMSVGLEISSNRLFDANTYLQSAPDRLLETSSIDVLYRVRPDSAGVWHLKEALQQMQRDLGPLLQQSQLIWWTTDSSSKLIVNQDSLLAFQRILSLDQRYRSLWNTLLSSVLAPRDDMIITEDEIIKALNLPRPASGTGAPIVLIRPLKTDAEPKAEQRPAPALTSASMGLLKLLVMVKNDSVLPLVTLTNKDTSIILPIKSAAEVRRLTVGDLFRFGLKVGQVATGQLGFDFESMLRLGEWQIAVTSLGRPLSRTRAISMTARDTQYVAIEFFDQVLVADLTPPPGMVYIPAGRFLMGDNNGADDEKPEHEVYVDAFFMDQTEVTVQSYQRFLQVTKHREPEEWGNQLKNPQFPVVYVSWEDANAYAKWAAKRLPTEAEWEYAARGGFTGLDGKPKYKYPWGDEADSSRANFDLFGNSRNVKSYLPNDYGLYNMAGNVSEWCMDWYGKNYYEFFLGRIGFNPKGPEKGIERVVRDGQVDFGTRFPGNWPCPPNCDGGSTEVNVLLFYFRSANRYGHDSTNRNSFIGFRCAQDAR